MQTRLLYARQMARMLPQCESHPHTQRRIIMYSMPSLSRAKRFILCLALAATAFTFAQFITTARAEEAAPAAAPAGAPAATEKKEESMWNMIKKGGPTLVLLGACSIFTMTLLIERFMFYRKASANTADLIDRIKKAGTMSE